MRDTRKTIGYFTEFINEEWERVINFSDRLKDGKVKPERVEVVKSKLLDLKLGIITARYSRGDELSLLEKEYLGLIDEWEEVWEPNYYNKNLKMISLGVLFEADNVFSKEIKNKLMISNVNDWLLNFLLDFRECEQMKQSKELLFPNVFSNLQRAVLEEDTVKLLKKYLCDDWYNEDCGCYDAHKSKQNIYYGYWSFEAGAIAKILNLDDGSLKDVPYYPYDLVHYKNNS